MISDFIERLQQGSHRPSDLGSRYARLLEILWQRTDNDSGSNRSVVAYQLRQEPVSQRQHRPLNSQNGFSWLDLQSVNEFLSADPDLDVNIGFENLQQFEQGSRPDNMAWNDMGWPADDDMNHLF